MPTSWTRVLTNGVSEALSLLLVLDTPAGVSVLGLDTLIGVEPLGLHTPVGV